MSSASRKYGVARVVAARVERQAEIAERVRHLPMFGAEVAPLAREGIGQQRFRRGEVAALALQAAVASQGGGEKRFAAVASRPPELDRAIEQLLRAIVGAEL